MSIKLSDDQSFGSFHDDDPQCPYCGHVDRDAWEIDFGSSDEAEVACGACGNDYIVTQHTSRTYSTSKPRTTPTHPTT